MVHFVRVSKTSVDGYTKKANAVNDGNFDSAAALLISHRLVDFLVFDDCS
jgi:hypothetical protein